MALGKHVYCQKPLTYTIHEARLMNLAAEHFKVKTQMGNQAHAGEPIRRAVELIRAGIIGPVREVHAWTNRPIWQQGAKVVPKPFQVLIMQDHLQKQLYLERLRCGLAKKSNGIPRISNRQIRLKRMR